MAMPQSTFRRTAGQLKIDGYAALQITFENVQPQEDSGSTHSESAFPLSSMLWSRLFIQATESIVRVISKLCLLTILLSLNGPALSKVINEGARLSVPVRLKKPITVSYHSHWFLLGSLRLAYRPINATTDFNVSYASAVTNGCGPQTTECIEKPALNLGIRHYVSESAFAAYVGSNVHWLFEGIRFFKSSTPMVDLSVGFNHQTQGNFNWGLGYSMFVFDAESAGLSLVTQGWILSELGYSF